MDYSLPLAAVSDASLVRALNRHIDLDGLFAEIGSDGWNRLGSILRGEAQRPAEGIPGQLGALDSVLPHFSGETTGFHLHVVPAGVPLEVPLRPSAEHGHYPNWGIEDCYGGEYGSHPCHSQNVARDDSGSAVIIDEDGVHPFEELDGNSIPVF